MTRNRRVRIAASVAAACLALPQVSAAIDLDAARFDECRRVKCETTYSPNGASAIVEIRGTSQNDVGRLLALTVYNAATYEVEYYDTVEVPRGGDFIFRVAVDSLRPGSYTFSVGPRYSRALVGVGAFAAAPRVLRVPPTWRTHGTAEEYRR